LLVRTISNLTALLYITRIFIISGRRTSYMKTPQKMSDLPSVCRICNYQQTEVCWTLRAALLIVSLASHELHENSSESVQPRRSQFADSARYQQPGQVAVQWKCTAATVTICR